MVDNSTMATKSAVNTLPLLGSSVSRAPRCPQPGGGMRLEALMETLQRQQEEKLRQKHADRDIRSVVESHIQHRAMALRQYRAAVQDALAARDPGSSSEDDRGVDAEDRDPENDCVDDEDGDDDTGESFRRGLGGHALPRAGEPPCATPGRSDPHVWTYEEQFKQIQCQEIMTPSRIGRLWEVQRLKRNEEDPVRLIVLTHICGHLTIDKQGQIQVRNAIRKLYLEPS